MGYAHFTFIIFQLFNYYVLSKYPAIRNWEFTKERETVVTGRVYTECGLDLIAPMETRESPDFHWVNINNNITADSIFDGDYGMTAVIGMTFKPLADQKWNCWVSDENENRQNHEYQVEVGQLADNTGESYTAFKVHPPSTVIDFPEGHVGLYLSFPADGEMLIYSFDDQTNVLNATGAINVPEGNVMVSANLTIDMLEKPTIFFGVPAQSSEQPSIFTKLADGIHAATVFEDDVFTVSARTYSLLNVNNPPGYVYPYNEIRTVGHPYNPTDKKRFDDFNFGPADDNYKYGALKRFFQVYNNGIEGVVWQDVDTWRVFVTWFGNSIEEYETIRLPDPYYQSILNPDNETFQGFPYLLESAVSDSNGQIAYMMISIVGKIVEYTKFRGFKSDAVGQLLNEADYDSDLMNISAYFHSGSTLKWNTETNELGLILANFCPTAYDGVKHMHCAAFIFDAADMSFIKDVGSVASRCWSNALTVSNGKFLGAAIGDSLPRAIVLTEFDRNDRKDKLVYNFKTRHFTEPQPRKDTENVITYEPYPEISTEDTTYYKGSHDNDIYTEMAQSPAIEVNNGNALLVIFAGESPPLDQANIGKALNAPRNLGFVKVARSFDDDTVLSEGPTVNSEYYDMQAQLHHQVNKGINWITDWTNKYEDNVSRLKALKLWETSDNENILVLFEKWTDKEYKSTELMILNQDGETIHPMRSSTYDFRLPWADEIYLTADNTVVFYSGVLGELTRYEIELNLGSTELNLGPNSFLRKIGSTKSENLFLKGAHRRSRYASVLSPQR